jgi:hypothetical protein
MMRLCVLLLLLYPLGACFYAKASYHTDVEVIYHFGPFYYVHHEEGRLTPREDNVYCYSQTMKRYWDYNYALSKRNCDLPPGYGQYAEELTSSEYYKYISIHNKKLFIKPVSIYY